MRRFIVIEASQCREITTLQEALRRAELSVSTRTSEKIYICEVINVVTRKVSAETTPFFAPPEPEIAAIADPKNAKYILVTPDHDNGHDEIFPPSSLHGKELKKWYRERLSSLPMDWVSRPAIRCNPDYTE